MYEQEIDIATCASRALMDYFLEQGANISRVKISSIKIW